MRFDTTIGLTTLALALVLSACSGDAPDAAAPEAANETGDIAGSASEGALEGIGAPAPGEAVTPEASASPTQTPSPSAMPTAAPVAQTNDKTAGAPMKVAVGDAPPPASFGPCAVCHTATKSGENKLGPNLYGTYGRKAAQVAGFRFSDAYRNAGLTLDEATLHKWLENPRALVPGNRMSFAGIRDAAKRQEIIDYLKQQS